MLNDLINLQEVSWFNENITTLKEAFPETAATQGIIESEVITIAQMKKILER